MKRIGSSILLAILLFCAPTLAVGSPLDEVKNHVNQSYKGTVPANLNEMTTIDEIEKNLDLYSKYFSLEEYDRSIAAINHQTVGIGVVLQEDEKGIKIVDVFANGPAAKAGIVAGTIITAVNQESMLGKSVEEAISRITGPVDSSVTIQVLEQTGKTRSLTLMREAVRVPVVNRKMLYGNVGYIRITSFSDDVGSHFEEAMTSLKVDGAKSFIVDLRNNGGGFVSSARDIVGYFPQSPLAYHLFYKERDELVASTKQTTTLGENAKLLINKYSASASEMTAAAVKDQHSAVLYGQTSFGKGSMQSYLEISNGDVMKLTIAEFTGPNGTQVNHVGVAPDRVTDKGLELIQAHLDEVESTLSTYNKLTTLSEVPLDKTFNITFSQPMMSTDAESAIELVELGGTALPVTLERVNSKKFTVKPNALLQTNKKYLLIIHPKMKNYKSMIMVKGAYLEVSTRP